MIYCPQCHSPTQKARLDVRWCRYCQSSWLIKKLKYKNFEEASETNHEARLKQDFLAPLVREHIIERDRELLEKLNTGSKKIRVPPKER